MTMLDLSKGFWATLSAYLSLFSWFEVFAIVGFFVAAFFFLKWLVRRERMKDI